MSDCGCKDPNNSREILPAMLQDGEAVIPPELAEKYRQSVREQKIKINHVNNDSDLEARNRMLEAELDLWKKSFNELSEEYIALVGGEDFNEPNNVPQPNRKTTKVVVEYHMDVVMDENKEIEACDVFDTIEIKIKDNAPLNIESYRFGITAIGDTVIPKPE